jgi:hypothetical protein
MNTKQRLEGIIDFFESLFFLRGNSDLIVLLFS